MGGTVLADVIGQGECHEAASDPRGESAQEGERGAVVGAGVGQRGVQAFGHAAQALHEGEFVEGGTLRGAAQGEREEAAGIEAGVESRHLGSDESETIRVEHILERGSRLRGGEALVAA